MKKILLTCNAVFYAILYSASLLFAGFCIGGTYQSYSGPNFVAILFPIVYLVFLIIGIQLVRECEYSTGKSYYAMAIATLGFAPVFLDIRLIAYIQSPQQYQPTVGNLVFPIVRLFFSLVISVIYVICAVQTRKQVKQSKWY